MTTLNVNGFRCPKCAQAQEVHQVLTDENTDGEQSEVLITTASPDGKMFNDSGDSITSWTHDIEFDAEAHCPKCEESSDFRDWIRAFDQPLVFFETENLCHCGGEMWAEFKRGSFVMVCEKCDHVKKHLQEMV